MARWGAKSAALSETDRNKDAIFLPFCECLGGPLS
jgi:hypothetical protein